MQWMPSCRRLLRLLLRYSAVMLSTAGLLHLLPGSPWSELESLPESVQQALAAQAGLQDSLIAKAGHALRAAFTWDFGPSLAYPTTTCQQIVLRAWPLSLFIGLWTLLLAWPLSWLAACWCAAYPRRWNRARPLLSLLLSCPSFLVIGIAIWQGWASPVAPLARQITTAVLSLVWIPFAQSTLYLTRELTRQRTLPFMQHAIWRGQTPFRALFEHALLPALARLSPFFAPQAAVLITGSIAVEKALCLPGLGSWFVESVLQRDAPMVLALTACFTLTLLVCSAVAEILRLHLDPRSQSLMPGGSA